MSQNNDIYLYEDEIIACTCPRCRKVFTTTFSSGQSVPADISDRVFCGDCVLETFKEWDAMLKKGEKPDLSKYRVYEGPYTIVKDDI